MTVEVSTGTGGTARAGVDFTPARARLEFAASNSVAQLMITKIIDNSEVNSPKTIALQFSNPSNGAALVRTNVYVPVMDNEYSANIDLNFKPPVSEVFDWAVQPDGKILLWGLVPDDLSFPATRHQAFARLRPDGHFDSGFQPRIDPPGASIAIASLDDGAVLIAGSFEGIDGVKRPGLARLLSDGRLDPEFVPVIDEMGCCPRLIVQARDRYLIQTRDLVLGLRISGEVDSVLTQNLATQQEFSEQVVMGIVEQSDDKFLCWFRSFEFNSKDH